MALDLEAAREVLHEEANKATTCTHDKSWIRVFERLSDSCEAANIRTHVAFVGTALLAKATDQSIDVYSVKSTDAKGSYSARRLGHEVLVKESAGLGIHLGVTGREPLNNQPYFRMERLDDGTRVHSSARSCFAVVLEIIARLAQATPAQTRAALRAFIAVRRRYLQAFEPLEGEYFVSADGLATIIEKFVSERSDGGRRAQAVVAGLLDAMVGKDRVFAGRVNDPSRHYPGDVAIRGVADVAWEKSFEVRDKPITRSDVQIFVRRCVDMGVREAGVIATAGASQVQQLGAWAAELGAGLRVFTSWDQVVSEVLFWGTDPAPTAGAQAIKAIHERLIEIEAPADAVQSWESHTERVLND